MLVRGKGGEKREEEEEGLRWVLACEEMKKLGCLAAPMVAVVLSQFFIQVVSVMMVGHLGELALSSTAVAISLSSVTGFSLLVSLSLMPLLYSLFFHFFIFASMWGVRFTAILITVCSEFPC